MSRLVETIRIENGIPGNIIFHNERMSMAIYNLFGIKRPANIEDFLDIPGKAATGIWKCRVIYERTVKEVQFIPYSPRIIRSLKLVTDDTIAYPYKFTDRSSIIRLFDKRDDCDDILIIRKGLVTDTSYSNVIFRTVAGRWVTPSSYLLPGTMRASLLHSGAISETDVGVQDIGKYKSLKIINSMVGIADTDEIPVSMIS